MLKYILFFLLISSNVYADVFKHPVKDIEEITDNVYVPSKLSGDFAQEKEIKEVDITLNSKGKFAIDNKKGIKWETLKPYSNVIIIENGRLCMKNAGETQLIDSKNNQAMKHVITIMQSLLVQDYKRLSEHFDIFFEKEDGYFEVGLKTTDATIAAVFTSLKVKGKKYIEEVVLLNGNDDETTIYFSNIEEKTEDFSCEK